MSKRLAILLFAVSVAVASGIAPVRAATLTWDGGSASDSDIDTSANWNPNAVPGTGDFLIFDGNTRIPLLLN